jgi:hypothetical protein
MDAARVGNHFFASERRRGDHALFPDLERTAADWQNNTALEAYGSTQDKASKQAILQGSHAINETSANSFASASENGRICSSPRMVVLSWSG